MRIHEIQKQVTRDGEWIHVEWCMFSITQAEKRVDRLMSTDRAWLWRIIPYLKKDDDIKTIMQR